MNNDDLKLILEVLNYLVVKDYLSSPSRKSEKMTETNKKLIERIKEIKEQS